MQQHSSRHYIRDNRYQPTNEGLVIFDRATICALILQQWKNINRADLESTGYNKRRIALLIEDKYGVHHRFTESYLSNLERTLPRMI